MLLLLFSWIVVDISNVIVIVLLARSRCIKCYCYFSWLVVRVSNVIVIALLAHSRCIKCYSYCSLGS